MNLAWLKVWLGLENILAFLFSLWLLPSEERSFGLSHCVWALVFLDTLGWESWPSLGISSNARQVVNTALYTLCHASACAVMAVTSADGGGGIWPVYSCVCPGKAPLQLSWLSVLWEMLRSNSPRCGELSPRPDPSVVVQSWKPVYCSLNLSICFYHMVNAVPTLLGCWEE